jgi:hypothetical protein
MFSEVKPAPVLSVTPANSSVQLTGNYTVMMVDADFVGASVDQITRHWLVNYVTVSGTAVSNATANEPTPYAGPFPAENSGKHRYVILMYEQPATFANPAEFVGGVTKINLQEYVKVCTPMLVCVVVCQTLLIGFSFQTSGLGNLVAGTYIQVEQGSASFSVAATSAVVTSTLPAAKTTAASGSGSGSKTAGGPSNSVTGSGSPAPTGGASSMTINSVVALGAAAVGAVFML